MPRTIPGDLDGRSQRIAVLVARWNPAITDRLCEGALAVLATAGVTDVTVVEVPGTFELPQAAARLAPTGAFDAIVALGCVLKGETIHDRVIADACAKGLMDVAVATRVPVTFGVVTADSQAQAEARSDLSAGAGKGGHKGKEAAEAAVRLVNALRKLEAGS